MAHGLTHAASTKTTSSQQGNKAQKKKEEGVGKGYKLSEQTALKKSVSFPCGGLRGTLHHNLINTGLLTNAFENDFELLHGA